MSIFPIIDIGKKGEILASDYYRNLGGKVLERNYRYRRCEIDLIVKLNSKIIFCEVKTRRSVEYGYPENFLSSSQISRIILASEHYIYTVNWLGDVRYDLISINFCLETNPEIILMEDAFF